MNRRLSCIGITGWFIGGLAVVFFPSCDMGSRHDPRRFLTDAKDARRVLEEALEAWHNSPQLERTVSTIRPVMFVDQQRQPGQRLLKFSVLGETPGVEGYRRFLVKLFLDDPEESLLVSYYVFGQDPFWVYRAEDFDMLMHMDHSMMSAPPSRDAASEPSHHSKTESEHAHAP